VLNGDNPLDKTAIHPESYKTAEQLLDNMEASPESIGSTQLIEKLNSLLQDNARLQELATELETDNYTLQDILQAFKKPLYDPREE